MPRKLRGRVRIAVAAAVALGLAALTALADVLLAGLGETAAAKLGDDTTEVAVHLAHLRTQTQAIEVVLWLGALALAALAIALGWSALHLLVLRRIEAAQRTAAENGELAAEGQGDELDALVEALAQYRRQLAGERADRSAQAEALGQLQGAADVVAAQLQQADRLALVGRVAMGLAHEIGGPLAILGGYLERLEALERADAPLDKRMHCIDQARHAADRIHALLSDLAAPGLPQTRELDRPCDLGAVVVRVAAQAEQHPRARTLQVQLDIAEAQHAADASASHMEQVLLNLLVNASDASRGPGKVAMSVRRQGDWQVVYVDDDGPGIEPALRERVFDEFYSTKAADGAQASRRSGWGLGLAVSRRIVERYGGGLRAEDSPLGGARFSLRVPVPGSLRKAARQSGVRTLG